MPKETIATAKETSDGSTAAYYELPRGAWELQHLIGYKDMNAQMGEIFRATYRYGQVSHSDKIRDIKKILFYAKAELDRLESSMGFDVSMANIKWPSASGENLHLPEEHMRDLQAATSPKDPSLQSR